MSERTNIGDLLRQAREQRGLTIEQAAADAGVPPRYLRLLEGEQVNVGIPDEFYLIPFFRRYAAFVGLDVVQLLPDFLSQVQRVPDAPAPAPLSYRPSLKRVWKPAGATLAAALAALILLNRGGGLTPSRSEPGGVAIAEPAARAVDAVAPADAPIPVIVSDEPSVDAAAAASVEAAETAPGATVAEPAPAPPVAAGESARRELRIVASEPTWLSIGLDDEPAREFLLQPGDSQTWTANATFTLKIGNAGGVALALDGHDLPALGTTGQVVRVQLPRTPSPSGDG